MPALYTPSQCAGRGAGAKYSTKHREADTQQDRAQRTGREVFPSGS